MSNDRIPKYAAQLSAAHSRIAELEARISAAEGRLVLDRTELAASREAYHVAQRSLREALVAPLPSALESVVKAPRKTVAKS